MNKKQEEIWIKKISLILAMPVDMRIGFPFFTIYFMRGKSHNSNEAILYAGDSSFYRRSTAVSSKGEVKIVISIFFAYSNNSSCHS